MDTISSMSIWGWSLRVMPVWVSPVTVAVPAWPVLEIRSASAADRTGSKPEPHEGEAGDPEDGGGEPEREQEELVGRSEEEEDRGQDQLEDARPR